jgi:hypothetical protein
VNRTGVEAGGSAVPAANRESISAVKWIRYQHVAVVAIAITDARARRCRPVSAGQITGCGQLSTADIYGAERYGRASCCSFAVLKAWTIASSVTSSPESSATLRPRASLATAKRRYDPQNMFRDSHNISPA